MIAAQPSSSDPTVLKAIDSLEEFRREKTPAQKQNLLTNLQLHDLLVKQYGGASDFEKNVLGSAPQPSMQHGNPNHKNANA